MTTSNTITRGSAAPRLKHPLIAAAALAAAALFSSAAQASIVYSSDTFEIIGSQTVNNIYGINGFTLEGYIDIDYSYSRFSINGGTIVDRSTLGQSIDSTRLSNYSPGQTFDAGSYYFDYPSPTEDNYSGYVGFAFNNNGITNYGWFQETTEFLGDGQMNITSSNASLGYKTTVTGMAYENSGAAILVGDTGPAPSAVPEPSSLAMMALGGLALLGSRRRRAAKA